MQDKRAQVARQRIEDKMCAAGMTVYEAALATRAEYEALGLDGQTVEGYVKVAVAQIEHDLGVIEMLTSGHSVRRVREEWYTGPQAGHRNWPRLKTYLTDEKGWDCDTVESIDEASTRVVSLLDNPGKAKFTTRGLVVGYVQSGKTANMTAVMAKAADVGFRFFIILAGLTDALRQQTQLRIQSDLVARNPEGWHWKTSFDCDFQDNLVAGFVAVQPGIRQIAVVKKNRWVLEKLLKKLSKTNKGVLANLPVLIIDDECDHASVNAARYKEEMTAINGLIRRYLKTIPRCSYVGYTATPFANVLIDPSVSVDPERPDDLYPADFIYALPQPPAYFGAERLFGRDLLEADETPPDKQGLDMIRNIADDEVPRLRPKNAKERFDFEPEATPSLTDGLQYYLMATAARIARGQGEQHSSMLVHTTSYVDPHFKFSVLFDDWLGVWHERVKSSDAGLLSELRALWERETSRVSATQFGRQHLSFEQLMPHLLEVAESVQVVVENGRSDVRLDFTPIATEDGHRGRRYIVVGGNVLARGLTIEGLVVSFFLRTSSQYDTLMQMGRWFGYRHGWEDLPRIWMSQDMREAFRALALVEAEIRYDIELYERYKRTPLEFAVRIRQIPGLRITAKNKMTASEAADVSFANRQLQTRRFCHTDANWLASNWRAGSELVERCGGAIEVEGAHVFRGVGVSAVLDFLTSYQVHPTHAEMASDALTKYIRSQNERSYGALSQWNVAVMTPTKGNPSDQPLGPLGKVTTSIRSRWALLDSDADIKALMSRRDVVVDLDNIGRGLSWADLKSARWSQTKTPLLVLYPIDRVSEPAPAYARSRDRLDADGDVLGMGILFPPTEVDTPVKYIQVILPEEGEEIDIPEEDS